MCDENLLPIKRALLQLRAEGPKHPKVGICGNLRGILGPEYYGRNLYPWVAEQAAKWPELNGRSSYYPIGDISNISWNPEDKCGARRYRFLDYLIECAGADDE